MSLEIIVLLISYLLSIILLGLAFCNIICQNKLIFTINKHNKINCYYIINKITFLKYISSLIEKLLKFYYTRIFYHKFVTNIKILLYSI